MIVTIVLGPIIAFLTIVAAEALIDLLKERAAVAAIVVCAVAAETRSARQPGRRHLRRERHRRSGARAK
jgi:uncharacterized membrane protein